MPGLRARGGVPGDLLHGVSLFGDCWRAAGRGVGRRARCLRRVGSATVDIAHRLGADAVIDYAGEDLKARIKEITEGGSDLVVDPVGGAYAEQALRAIRWGGRFVSVGFAAGDVPRIPLNLVLLKNVTVRGMELRSWSQQMPEAVAAADADLARLVADGMRPEVTRTHPLAEVPKALADVAGRKALGKTVIDVRG